MLTCLRVRNFAIIDELELELAPGLNVVTGETGAGKSILIEALELVLGGKARTNLVRSGEKQAEVEALFEIGAGTEVDERLSAFGIDLQGEVIVRRVISATGRTRGYINGQLATAAQLKATATGLADISSQHEHHSLTDPRRHLDYLDAFGGHQDLRAKVQTAHRGLADADRAERTAHEQSRHRTEREDLLRFQIQEIDTLGPQPGELQKLEEEHGRLHHAVRLAEAAAEAEAQLYNDDDAIGAVLSRVALRIEEAASLDPSLGSLARQLESARTQIEDAAQELGSYARRVSLDPQRLSEVEGRLNDLHRLIRKYGGSLELVLSHRETAGSELAQLEDFEHRLEQLGQLRKEAFGNAREVARTLRAKRERSATRLGKAISKELSTLGMGDAKVQVDVSPLEGSGGELDVDGARLGPSGIDRVEFLIAPNRGEEAQPLRLIASGGELSRALLAIKRVLAGLRPAGLYVFDEVDSGVGGAVAEVIGQKLRDVAEHHQVLCITHLPQIAAFADQHFFVSKAVSKGRTRSHVEALDQKARTDELARMLGGIEVTQRSRDAAAEMLNRSRPTAP